MNKLFIGPPANSVEIGETYNEKFTLTNNDPECSIDFAWEAVSNEFGMAKITPAIGEIPPGQSMELNLSIISKTTEKFQAILHCCVPHVKSEIQLACELKCDEVKIDCLDSSMDFGVLRCGGTRQAHIRLQNSSLKTAEFEIKTPTTDKIEISGCLSGILASKESRNVSIIVRGLEEDLDFAEYLEIHSKRYGVPESNWTLSTVLPIRGQISTPKIVPKKSLIEVENCYAPDVSTKVPVSLSNNGLLPVVCEFNSFAIDKSGDDDIELTELSCNGGKFEFMVLNPSETIDFHVHLAWRKPYPIHQINLLFNAFAIDALSDGNDRLPTGFSRPETTQNLLSNIKKQQIAGQIADKDMSNSKTSLSIPVTPVLVAIRAAPQNIKLEVDDQLIKFEKIQLNQVAFREVNIKNLMSIPASYTARLTKLTDNKEISCYLNRDKDEVTVSFEGENSTLTVYVKGKMFGVYYQELEIQMGVRTVKIPIEIEIIGCPSGLQPAPAPAPAGFLPAANRRFFASIFAG